MNGNVDQAALDFLRRQVLAEGERVRWRGRPLEPGRLLARDWFKSLFALVFFLFSCVWTVMALLAGGVLALFGLLFVAIGGWLLSQPWRNFKRARETYYAITDKRVVILTGHGKFRVVEIHPGQIDDYEPVDKGGDRGDLGLRRPRKLGAKRHNSRLRSLDEGKVDRDFYSGLWDVADLQEAHAAILALRPDLRAQ